MIIKGSLRGILVALWEQVPEEATSVRELLDKAQRSVAATASISTMEVEIGVEPKVVNDSEPKKSAPKKSIDKE